MGSAPLVYIIVLNYCSFDDSIACVEKIRLLTYRNYKLLVVDNDSPDQSGHALQMHLRPREFIQLPDNTGYAGGNNTAISTALELGADYILVVNPDVRLPPNSIDDYIDVFERDPLIGALNPIQIGSDNSSVDNRFSWMIYGKYLSLDTLLEKHYELYEAKTLLGAAIMFSGRTLERVGGFDPLYFAYGEELDLCRRIRYHNLKLVVTNKSPVLHLRTHENTRIDDFRLFLRLKGIYLNELKDPHRPFYKSVSVVLKKFKFDLQSDSAPYAHPFTKRHYIKVGIWLLIRIPVIYHHIRLDKKGDRPYLR